MVPAEMRGKLGGVFNAAEYVGRCIRPATCATAFAWSVSPSAYLWVYYRFLFYASAALMAAVTVVAWRTLTMENIVGLSKIRIDDIAPDDDASGIKHGAVDTFRVSLTGVETPT